MGEIIVEGHRGYCARYPENTLVSFSAAIDLGVDALEFDVWLSRDGIPVIMHDGNAMRTTGVNRHLRDMAFSQIRELDAGRLFSDEFAGERVPSLKDTLDLIRNKKPSLMLGVEIKEYTFDTVDITVALLKEYEMLNQCCFYCFNARIIKYLKQKWGVKTMGYPSIEMAEFETDSYKYYDEIGINIQHMTPEICRYFKCEMGFPLHLYCADTTDAVIRCIENEASLITANDPVPLIQYLKQTGRRI
jgi:glycerophosphoryl diester phosphodiesterase